MTYGSEVWTANKHTRTKLMTAEMDFWRCSARVSRRCLLYTSNHNKFYLIKEESFFL